ncbi:hypothetical protein [Paenarthrobacter sp. Z7-10]|uniref:hypothetical protein n=1 Tax=Paenarthrobacter sp. Z7-10 TaxID=2787635 RepID=UPI0022A99119|nr:hypothetical protein [Paenarthrobacter sp. Z7-10]
MGDPLDPGILLESARRAMKIAVEPDRFGVRSVELHDGQIELIFNWNEYPDPLGVRFDLPDNTAHRSWAEWAPATVEE